MGKVRPTRIATPRIIQPEEGRARPWLWLLLLAVLGLWSWQVFEFGRRNAGFDIGQSSQVESALRERIATLEEEREALRVEAARFERDGQIDQAAAEEVKTEVKTLQDERAELKREVAFLKSLVADGGRKLVLNDHSLTKVGEREYRFEVTVAKRTDDQLTVSGQVIVSVKGDADGQSKVLDMASLTDGRRSSIGIRFKSFQKLKTEFQLPEGFVPASLEVAVRPEGKDFKSFERAFDWKPSDA